MRREMRFRNPSATRAEEEAAAAARSNGAAEAAKLRRQQSEPMGQPATPPSGSYIHLIFVSFVCILYNTYGRYHCTSLLYVKKMCLE